MNLLAVSGQHAVVPAGEGRLDIRDLLNHIPPFDRRPQSGHEQVQEPPPETLLHRHVDCRHLALGMGPACSRRNERVAGQKTPRK